MFSSSFHENKYALIMANELKGCQEDIRILNEILPKFNFIVTKKIICFPEIEIDNFLKNKNNGELIYIHYSGHGTKRGVKINNQYKILSSWINPDKSIVSSNKIDSILSKYNCKIILTTDCCHSETFGDYYSGKFPFIFIGTSKLGMISKTYSLNCPLHGSLIYLFEFLLNNNMEISVNNIKNLWKKFFKENNIESTIIIKEK